MDTESTREHRRFIREKALRQNVLGGIGRSTLWRWIREGTFPAPVKLGPRMVAWDVAVVDAWLAERPRTRETETIEKN